MFVQQSKNTRRLISHHQDLIRRGNMPSKPRGILVFFDQKLQIIMINAAACQIKSTWKSEKRCWKIISFSSWHFLQDNDDASKQEGLHYMCCKQYLHLTLSDMVVLALYYVSSDLLTNIENDEIVASNRAKVGVNCEQIWTEIFSSWVRCNDLTIGWQNLNLLSQHNATLAPQRQARASENLNNVTQALHAESQVVDPIVWSLVKRGVRSG